MANAGYEGPMSRPELRALAPVAMETVPLGLEDAFISYLGERGEKTFIMSETEVPL